jgi:hypothetical protein
MGGGGVLGAAGARPGGVRGARAGGTLGVVEGCGAGWAKALKASNAVATKALDINFISILVLVIPAAGQTRCGSRSLINGTPLLPQGPSCVHTLFLEVEKALSGE